MKGISGIGFVLYLLVESCLYRNRSKKCLRPLPDQTQTLFLFLQVSPVPLLESHHLLRIELLVLPDHFLLRELRYLYSLLGSLTSFLLAFGTLYSPTDPRECINNDKLELLHHVSAHFCAIGRLVTLQDPKILP